MESQFWEVEPSFLSSYLSLLKAILLSKLPVILQAPYAVCPFCLSFICNMGIMKTTQECEYYNLFPFKSVLISKDKL